MKFLKRIKKLRNGETMRIPKIKKLLTDYFEYENLPAFYIIGDPGIGKSEVIKEICMENNYNLKIIYFSSLALEHITGIPTMDKNSDDSAKWTLPQMLSIENLDLKFKDSDKIIFFFDDAHLIDINFQKYLFQLLTYKKINEWKLPDKSMLIFAGNNNSDNYPNMLSPITSRLIFVKMEVASEDWLDYAIKNNVNSLISSYIKYNDKYLLGEPKDNESWPNPRSWVNFSKILNANILENDHEIYEIAEGSVGKEAATDFMKYYKIYQNINLKKYLSKNEIYINNLSLMELMAFVTKLTTTTDKEIIEHNSDKILNILNSLDKIKYGFLIDIGLHNLKNNTKFNKPIELNSNIDSKSKRIRYLHRRNTY